MRAPGPAGKRGLTPARIERTTLWTGITRSTTELRGHTSFSLVNDNRTIMWYWIRVPTSPVQGILVMLVPRHAWDVSGGYRLGRVALHHFVIAALSEGNLNVRVLRCGQWATVC